MLTVKDIERELSRPEFAARFWKKIRRTRGCWIWRHATDAHGYGHLGVGYGYAKAHRIAWMLRHGVIPSSVFICHKCDRPSCVRPSHLFAGTQKDNCSDMASKDRSAFGERHGMAKLTEADVEAIRALHLAGFTHEYVASVFGISSSQAQRIARKQSWRRTK